MIATVSPSGARCTFSPDVPGSKSLTNRALVAAVGATGTSQVRRPLNSDDTRAMAGALVALGAEVEFGSSSRGDATWEITGPPARGGGPTKVWCDRAGTVARFLPPVAAVLGGTFEFEADPQMAGRPMEPLYEALRAQGVRVEVLDPPWSFPVRIESLGLSHGVVALPDSISSQFLSGLMLASPLAAEEPLSLRAKASVSRPYIDMTAAVMDSFGVAVEIGGDAITMKGTYAPCDFEVEPDASTASYFLAAAAVTGGTVSIAGLGLDSTTQGDARLASIFAEMDARSRPGRR